MTIKYVCLNLGIMLNLSNCEICGRKEAQNVISIEGARMTACRECSLHGKIVQRLHEDISHKETSSYGNTQPEEIESIIEGFGKIIHKKREELRLYIAVIAEKINEKESYLENIERGNIKPTISVARKIEKELGIKIIEKTREEITPSIQQNKNSKELTLAEFVVFEKDKKTGKK